MAVAEASRREIELLLVVPGGAVGGVEEGTYGELDGQGREARHRSQPAETQVGKDVSRREVGALGGDEAQGFEAIAAIHLLTSLGQDHRRLDRVEHAERGGGGAVQAPVGLVPGQELIQELAGAVAEGPAGLDEGDGVIDIDLGVRCGEGLAPGVGLAEAGQGKGRCGKQKHNNE